MKSKPLFVSLLLICLFITIGAIFYYQETQYLLPTPLPANYQKVPVGRHISLLDKLPDNLDKPVVLHFFNPQCPCSKFNMDYFQQLMGRYKDRVDFYAVLHVEEDIDAVEDFQSKYELNIPVILDGDKKLAKACGVYSTPQAAILTRQGELYYRGNYNKARYCTDPQSNYAQMALDSLLARKPAPVFVELATKSYGCELPEQSWEAASFSNTNF